MIRVQKYTKEFEEEWNQVIALSGKSTFLFFRNYMEYHSDRFVDHSLIFIGDKGLEAVLPACKLDDKLLSHSGLTYGGLICSSSCNTSKVLDLFKILIDYCHKNAFSEIIYKTIPWFYHTVPSDEDQYALFVNDAVLLRREVSSLIRIPGFRLPSRKHYAYRKQKQSGWILEESKNMCLFFNMVELRLKDKYGVVPVHTPQEMNALQLNFPANIRLFIACCEGVSCGGALLYINRRTVHVQYFASTPEGRKKRVYDFLIPSLLEEFAEFDWFDMGISTEDQGRYLNRNLIAFKEGYGASAACYDTYSLKILS